MDENKEKEELNDELLEQVSGGNVFSRRVRCQEMHVLQPDYPF